MPVGAIHSINITTGSDEKDMECFASTAQLLRPRKRTKIDHLPSIIIGYLVSHDGSRKAKHWKRMKILFHTGCGSTLINHKLV